MESDESSGTLARRLTRMDGVLESFLSAPDGHQSEQQLGSLLSRHAAPIVGRVIAYRLGAGCSDAEDVASQVMLQLMLRLRRERIGPDLAAIESFESYVATAAHHGCDHFLRGKYPLRWRLRNRLRYVLEHDSRFALWRGADGSLLCGRSDSDSRSRPVAPPPAGGMAAVPTQNVRELLAHVFDATGSPVEFTALVDAVADAWRIPLRRHDGSDALETAADRRPRVDDLLEQRGRLTIVWAQIRELPLRQRHALLLNLKGDAITAFLTTGTASLRDIASALELPIDEFAVLWNDLPLRDEAVAARLGSTRQQVINLRMSARKRLTNRLARPANIGVRPAL